MRYRKRSRALALALALLAALSASAGALARQTPPPGLTARPATVVSSHAADVGWDSRARAKPAVGGDTLVSVLVKLTDAPLAAYAGGIPGLAPTSPRATGAARLDAAAPASRDYLAYLDMRQRDFAARAAAAIPQARVLSRYRYVFGGVALALPARDMARLASLPGVLRVMPDEMRYAETDRSPTFIGADAIWRALAANPSLGDGGEGVIVGVIDTGIWPEHPSFADDGSYPPPPVRWHGACEAPLDQSPPIACTHKLIGARESLASYKLFIGLAEGEFDSARDDEGHGTHTASTAAGNAAVPALVLGRPRGSVSGIAPRAYVAAYKALGLQGGFLSDLVAAIDQAVADGVDVINYSIGGIGAPPDPYGQADSLAFLDAYRAGVVVSVSAGNSGPDPGSVSSPANAPWVISVAASTTDRHFVSRLTLASGGDRLTFSGASITDGVGGKRVVDAATLEDPYCEAPFSDVVSDTIVLCRRGVNARVEKSANVYAGHAAAMVLYNTTELDVETDNHWVPAIHLDRAAGAQVVAFTAAHSDTGVLGDITPGAPMLDSRAGDVIAGFSSRGPLAGDQRGVGKPDIAAPGVQILAGHTPAPLLPSAGPPGQLFQAIAGTSMAAPHVTGGAALLKALHPDWTPGQIKSALMTTAWTRVVKSDGVTPADPYDMGSGRIDLARAGDPGLTLDVTADQYAGGRGHLEDLNYPSIAIPRMPGRFSVTRTVHSVLDREATWTASTQAPPGVAISVNPHRIRVPARGYASFVVTIDAGGVPDGSYVARLLLRSGQRTLHLPVSFVRQQPDIALDKQCQPAIFKVGQQTTCTVSATNNGPQDADVGVVDQVPRGFSIRSSSVISATYNRATRTLTYVGNLPGAQASSFSVVSDPGGAPFGYVPLASLGIPPESCTTGKCDEEVKTYRAPPFTYDGATYDRITMTTNGHLVVGGDTRASFVNQSLPNPALPNNVLAPYWTDLDLDGPEPDDAGGGTWRAAYVTAGQRSPTWFVAEWTDAVRFERQAAESHHTFQVWIEGGSDRIHFVYGPNSPVEDLLTVGAENATGTAGANYYVDTGSADGSGTPPIEGDALKVNIRLGARGAHTLSYQMRGNRAGEYRTTAELTSSTFVGTSIVSETLKVLP